MNKKIFPTFMCILALKLNTFGKIAVKWGNHSIFAMNLKILLSNKNPALGEGNLPTSPKYYESTE